ncbi:ECF-type sigma factor [Simiduia curdlanivorans]|uniref:ECF-type sigma factor n=1 Tax=Simiduia curdlanivorans TaxID=1492769 RepID=A0ABV8V7Z8_9GAMM|nr:ECF-type sigma factor [Simiduia curdlanivorans]MDN3638613.1 ECF-type sigma factor [Simiduia curdlanivorans]
MPYNLDITQLLNEHLQGKDDVLDRIFPVVYEELRKIARSQLRKVWSVDTICTTALVNEAYLKLLNNQQAQPGNREHFFAIAATAMRHVLINYAEQKNAQKRGGDWQQVTYAEADLQGDHNVSTLLAVNDALEEIRAIDAQLARLVEMRFFGGMNEAEIALVFAVNERTVRRNWQKAKALLSQALMN